MSNAFRTPAAIAGAAAAAGLALALGACTPDTGLSPQESDVVITLFDSDRTICRS